MRHAGRLSHVPRTAIAGKGDEILRWYISQNPQKHDPSTMDIKNLVPYLPLQSIIGDIYRLVTVLIARTFSMCNGGTFTSSTYFTRMRSF